MAEQNFNQAIKIADRGYVIVHGEIEFEGDRRRLQQRDHQALLPWGVTRGGADAWPRVVRFDKRPKCNVKSHG